MWVENAKERWMNFYQLYLASLVARLLGASGVETFREASEGAGMDLASYVSQLGLGAVDIEDALALLNAAMGLADHLRVSTEGGMLEVKVHKPSCRMCPGLLNGSQPTPKCPLYGLVKGFSKARKSLRSSTAVWSLRIKASGVFFAIKSGDRELLPVRES